MMKKIGIPVITAVILGLLAWAGTRVDGKATSATIKADDNCVAITKVEGRVTAVEKAADVRQEAMVKGFDRIYAQSESHHTAMNSRMDTMSQHKHD